jgi:hypothetical protein
MFWWVNNVVAIPNHFRNDCLFDPELPFASAELLFTFPVFWTLDASLSSIDPSSLAGLFLAFVDVGDIESDGPFSCLSDPVSCIVNNAHSTSVAENSVVNFGQQQSTSA